MVDHFLSDFGKSGVFREVWYVSVHVAIYLDMFHHLVAVGFQSAIEVVKIVDAAHASSRGVEQFSGDGFGQRVVTLLFPSAYQVVAVGCNHPVQFGYLIGTVLQIGIHGYYHIAFGAGKSGIQRR